MSPGGKRPAIAPAFELHNVYRAAVPSDFKRVALLPIVSDPNQGISDSLDSIKQSITSELLKAKKYEIIAMTGDDLREIAGVGQLTSLDVWPDKLRKNLQEKLIDGVMIVEITSLKGYAPIAIGLKARLVNLADGKTYWACDEVFDSAVPEMYAGAKKFETGMLMTVGKLKSQGSIDLSPTQFAKYAAFTMFETLP